MIGPLSIGGPARALKERSGDQELGQSWSPAGHPPDGSSARRPKGFIEKRGIKPQSAGGAH